MDTIYIENEILEHPRTQYILQKYPRSRRVVIERYGDVFNAPYQSFRDQKNNPALILANKVGKRVLPTPPDYHIGGRHNYYFSHMLNCVYDCRYCFLQGMYRSANYVVFVNFEDFFDDIAEVAESLNENSWFFSGYDCDSLALEPMTQFVDYCLNFFEPLSQANLELRTKSTQIRKLLKRQPLENCVVAMSLSPEPIIAAEEHRTPSLEKRIAALKELQRAGWRIGLRFDPLIYATNFNELYGSLLSKTFKELDVTKIHSVSLGPFRLPKPFFKRMVKIYPESKLLAASLETTSSMVSYPADIEQEMLSQVETKLLQHISKEQYFPCVSVDQILET